MGESKEEEFEPLFDYSRVQPLDFINLDDDEPFSLSPKRMKKSNPATGNVETVIELEEEEDWLPPPPPPPKVFNGTRRGGAAKEENDTIKALRLKKQELVSFANSAEDMLRAVEESAKRNYCRSLESSMESDVDQPSKPHDDRAKIVISIQDKDEVKQFRVYVDDKFEKLFKIYAEKVKRGIQSLVFLFDGDKVNPTATPGSLDMEDNDIIEVNIKSI
ncbi:hypothetical protein GIB67_028865 [Kingdonia uniflora]|uniref:Rad60/SUMO-like domain-containing protein n=1 Tax=Kingdonia uniflora TaxID=39325 RepID=A0A7J7LTM8_9MAGN|nr:hypothetical protein GIB67_028865 [Kingdonia uniflora]